MRIVVKGGVWKNTEDEILKAAVSKYGKNQWARISSLLTRKTPKQCKARWYEWLDPSIRKTEWSKEEDEKLLHLAKLMPTQWRTIAPIIGRTSNQCLERYQKLLDDAEAKEHADLGLTGTDDARPSADDVRKLRPGEVDPDPETKPARPDPIDMDEDEKEMLSEARARLANTQGKKAKRKARERQLEEARRLAMLQKRRELKAAGINIRPKNKNKGMDYNGDIPFEKQPAPGFYDTTEELNKRRQAPIGKTLRQLEGPKRKINEEEEERKKRQKKSQQEKGMDHFNKERDNQIQAMKQAEQIANRTKLNLPAPQVSERELEDIVKVGQAGESARALVDENGNEVGSSGLLGDYSALSHAKDARTPRTAPQEDTVMLEARNLRNMTEQQTPLLGEENSEYTETPMRGTGFQGATPRNTTQATPNPLATPFRRPGSDVSATPRTAQSGALPEGTPLRTPMRDNLAINADATPMTEVAMTPRDEKMRAMQSRQKLRAGFDNLPAPKNEFELVDPEDEAMPEEEKRQRIEDAAERDARNAAIRAEEERKALARRSQAVKLNLPRPAHIDAEALISQLSLNETSSSSDAEVDRLVALEMIQLLQHDAVAHPVAGTSALPPANARKSLAEIPDDDLAAARSMVHSELASSIGFPGASETAVRAAISTSVDWKAFQEAWDPANEALAFDVKSRGWVEKSMLSAEEYSAGLRVQIDELRTQVTNDAAKAAKGERRLEKMLGGYQARAKKLADQLRTASEEMSLSHTQYQTFSMLHELEIGAIPRRIESLQMDVEELMRRERDGQSKFQELSAERDQLESAIAEMEEEIMMRQAEAANEAAMAAEA